MGKEREIKNTKIIEKLKQSEEQARILAEKLQKEIAEHKKTEETLGALEERLNLILGSLYDIIFQLSPLGFILYVSPGVEKIYGYNPNDLIGQHLKKTTPVSELPRALEALRFVLSGKVLKNFQISQRDAKGNIVNMEITGVPVIKNGKVIAAQGVMRDITERKQMEEELKNSQERLKILFEFAPDAYYLSDLKGTFIDGNKMAEEIIGYKKEELIGKSFLKVDLLSPLQIAKAAALLLKNTLGQPTGPDEFILNRKDGSQVTVEISTYPIKIKDKNVVLGIARDITKRKQAEEELKNAYEQLKQTQSQLIQSAKMASVGLLATGVAHEINNPLAVILGEAEMLLRDKDKDKETKDASKIIMEQSERIKVITEKILEFSSKREFQLQPLNINNLLKDNISLLRYQIQIGGIRIIDKFETGLPEVRGDKNQLQEVFLNLMLNSVQAMKNGGTITIRTYSEEITEDGRRKTDKFKLGDRIVVIEIKDTGEGMGDEVLKRLFEPFFTTREKGTGLGLFISYGIIESHGGIIEAESKLGKGSTFIVKLPVV